MAQFNQQERWHADLGSAPGEAPVYLLTHDSLIVGAGSSLSSIDRFSGAVRYRHVLTDPVTVDPRCLGTFGGQLLVTDDHANSTIYVLDSKTGQLQHFLTVQGYVNLLLGVGRQLYAVSDQNFYLIGFAQRRWQILKQTGPGSMVRPVVAEGRFFGSTPDHGVLAFDVGSFSIAWQGSVNGPVTTTPAFHNGKVFVGALGQKTVYAFDSQTGRQLWESGNLPAALVANLAAGHDRVYAPCQDSVLYPLDQATGSSLGRIEQSQPAASSILVNLADENVYTATPAGKETEPAGKEIEPAIIAYAPASDNKLRYELGASPALLGTNGSDVYVSDGQEVVSLNFTDALKQFTIDSTLIQDFEANGAPVSQGQGLNPVPHYNTEIFLHNPDKTPLSDAPVKLRARVATTIKVAGVSYDLLPDQPVQLKTNAQGRLRVESKAGGISSPEFWLTTPFLVGDEEILIYPDEGVHNRLGTINGSDLRSARDYHDQSILAAKYQNTANARDGAPDPLDKAADAIKAVLTMVVTARTGKAPPAPLAARLRGIPVSEQMNAGAFLVVRGVPVEPHLVLPENWSLNLRDGAATFEIGITTQEARQSAARNEGSAPRFSLEEVWEEIKKGAKIAAAAVRNEAGKILTDFSVFIENAWVNFVDVILDTVEKAVHLAQGILNEITAKVESAVEWLSFVFDWSAILQKHTELKTQVLDTLETLKTGQQLTYVREMLLANFEHIKDETADLFNEIRTGIGQQSFNSHKTDADQSQLNAKSTWLAHKVTQNGTQGSAGAQRSDGTVGATTEVSVSTAVLEALNNFLQGIGKDFTDDFSRTFQQLVAGFSNLSASDFLAGSLAAILTVFEGVLDATIDVAKNLAVAAVDLFRALLSSGFLENLLTAELPLPFVKDLYTYLTDEPLTLLNLATLIVAIPVTIAERASEAGKQTRGLKGWNLSLLALPFWALINTGIEAKGGIDAPEENRYLLSSEVETAETRDLWAIVSSLGIAVPFVIQLLLIPSSLIGLTSSQTAPNVVLWTLPTCAIVIDIVTAIVTARHQLARFEVGGQVALTVLGVGTMVSIIVFAVENSSFKGKSTIASNVLLNVPLLVKLFRNFGAKGIYTVAAVDFFSGVIGGILAINAATDSPLESTPSTDAPG